MRPTKGKSRQREASSKSLLCNHYPFFQLCNGCFHGDWNKPVATSVHSAASCFHRNMYTGLPEMKLQLPSQTHQVAQFRNNKCPSNFVLRWSVIESLGVAEQLTVILSWVQCTNSRTSQRALLAVGWNYQTRRHHTIQPRKHQLCNMVSNQSCKEWMLFSVQLETALSLQFGAILGRLWEQV